MQISICDMYQEQELGVFLIYISLGMIFVGICFQNLDVYEDYISASLNVVIVASLFILFWNGRYLYNIFNIKQGITRYAVEKDKGK